MNYLDRLKASLETAQSHRDELDQWLRDDYASASVEARTTTGARYVNIMKLREQERLIKELERLISIETAETGTPATYAIGTDRYAGKVVNVKRYKTGKRIGQVSVITFQHISQGGLNGKLREARLDKRNYLVATGSSGIIHLGYAEDYRDPSF